MNDTQEVSIKFINTVTGDSKLKEYEKRLENIYGYISSIKAGQSKATKEVKNAVEGLGKEVDKTNEKTKGLSNTMKTAFNVAGIIATIKASAKLFKTLSKLVDLSSSYVENLNLLQVAYADIDEKTGKFNRSIEETSEEIQNFIDKMADVYGLDESKLTRQFGIFRQLANAMKLPTETASNLSELMVKMTNDIASLYNLDIDRASNALQSALAGQVRPIRSATGADITEKTLQNTVDALGLDRSISQLSYVEKRLVMVISLTDQLRYAQGDWGRTIESVANQVRIMHEQWNRLSRAVGNVFYPILEKVLPYLNAVLMVLTEIFNLIAKLFGYKEPIFDYSGLTGASDATLDLIDGMDEASASVDNLKDKLKGLRGFDKLNVINTPSNSGSSAGAGAGIDPAIMDAFNAKFSKYNDMMDEVNMKAREIRNNIMEWLGFEEIDGEFKFKKITFGTVAGVALGTLALASFVKIIGGIFDKIGLKGFYKTGAGKNTTFGFSSAIKWAVLITGLTLSAKGLEGILNEGNTWENVFQSLGGGFTAMAGTFLLTKSLTLTLLVGAITLVPSATVASKNLWNEILDAIDEYGDNDGKTTFKEIWNSWLEGCKEIITNTKGGFKETFNRYSGPVEAFFDNFKTRISDNKLDLYKWLEDIRWVFGEVGRIIKKWNDENWSYGGGGAGAFFGGSGGGGRAEGGIYANGQWHDITAYAGGGLPPVGQMFVAREAGPELVGKIGSHTAVMNNDQIVGSVSDGVYRAMITANRGQSQGTQVYNIYLDESHKLGTYTLEQLQDMAKTNGKPITITG